MGVKKTKPSEAAVVMQVHKRFSKRLVLGLLAVLLPVLIATGIAVYLITADSKDDSKPKSKAPTTTAEVIDATDPLRYSGDYDKAAEVSATAYDASKNNDEKYNIAQQTGAIYESNQDYKNALEWYKKAEAIKPDQRGSLVGLARAYEAVGDKAKAIEYYKKVLALKDTTGYGVQNDQPYYQYRLDQLTGAQ